MGDPYVAAGYTRQVPLNMSYTYSSHPYGVYSYGGYPGQVISPSPAAQGECVCVCVGGCVHVVCVCVFVCV